ncbi:MAG: WYL domain-containing protein [Thermodesulfobacteriota bacterium]|nr:WYL domain-containing protein [Thermodesulfobacteriota bacterium]
MGSNKSYETLKRQWLLLNRMPHRGRKGTKYFQEALREMGLDVSLRTIQRDLKELSRQFPLVSDEERVSGWKWSEDAAVFDIPGMDPHAALAFKMIDQHLAKMLPESCLNFLKPYSKRAGEVLNHLGDGGIAKWPKKIARISRHLALEPPEIDRLLLSVIYDGLLLERQLKISYCNRTDSETQKGIIHPLGLVFVDNIAYLVCTFWEYQDLRQIAVHRIDSAQLLNESSRTPAGFKLKDYIAKGNFDFPESEGTIQLKCLFHPHVAKHLAESPINQTQELITQSDGQIQLVAEIEDTAQLRWWLLGFGDQVEVTEPETLRNDIFHILSEAIVKYKQS